MTTLHDRLADLAEEAPGPLPAPGLWDRGRRYRRRRRAGTLAVLGATMLVLALLGGVTWHRAAAPLQPADGPAELPDRVWAPSPWLPSTDRPGRLVAITAADQGSWTGMRPSLVGVSATTGDYAFLDDLPDAAPDGLDEPVLSPDGRHIAYWLRGATTGTPNSDSGPVTGVGVFDTGTGGVSRHWIRTAHGLRPDFLSWADAGTVVFSGGQIRGGDDASEMDQATSALGTVMMWSLGSQPEPVPGVDAGASLIEAAHGRIEVDTRSSSSGREYRQVDLDNPSRGRFVSVPGISGSFNSLPYAAFDASGRRVALVADHNPNGVRAGVVGNLHVVPSTRRTLSVLDWLDDHTIVTQRMVNRLGLGGGTRLSRVSVSTGDFRDLVRLPAQGGGWQFATDLLSAPSVHADPPPRPLDPRWVTGLAVGTLVAAVAIAVLWRRRVRP
ncbi:hypothetical protein [Nocardioides ungokensis]|uniref:hypothetical protein n=1 Tax=Nocardioides ungokensis TaxID=1643322 RepID=UPI0015DDC84D|nr:hypothetical protein [Nocardioides ungokensis]